VATWERRNRTAVIVSGRLHAVRHVVRQEAKLLFIAARDLRLRPIDGGDVVQDAELESKVRLGEAICKDGGPWAADMRNSTKRSGCWAFRRKLTFLQI
jgi:hypothetical protein